MNWKAECVSRLNFKKNIANSCPDKNVSRSEEGRKEVASEREGQPFIPLGEM